MFVVLRRSIEIACLFSNELSKLLLLLICLDVDRGLTVCGQSLLLIWLAVAESFLLPLLSTDGHDGALLLRETFLVSRWPTIDITLSFSRFLTLLELLLLMMLLLLL